MISFSDPRALITTSALSTNISPVLRFSTVTNLGFLVSIMSDFGLQAYHFETSFCHSTARILCESCINLSTEYRFTMDCRYPCISLPEAYSLLQDGFGAKVYWYECAERLKSAWKWILVIWGSTYMGCRMRNRDIYTIRMLASPGVNKGPGRYHLFSYQVPPTPAFLSYMQRSTLRSLSGIRIPQ